MKTKSPIVPLFGISPASTSLLLRAGSPTGLEASIVIFDDFPAASASESNATLVPAPAGEKVEPVDLSNTMEYIPDGTVKLYLPSASVLSVVIILPSISSKVTFKPTIFVSPAS